MQHIGLNPERLRIEFMSSGDGIILADVINKFCQAVKELGPLGKSEGMTRDEVMFKLKAARNLVPFIRLAERERFRVPVKSQYRLCAWCVGSHLRPYSPTPRTTAILLSPWGSPFNPIPAI